MKEQVRRGIEPFLAVALLDNTGHVVALNQEWSKLATSNTTFSPGSSLAEIASGVPGLLEWVANADEVKREFSFDNLKLNAQIMPLDWAGDEKQSLLVISVQPGGGDDPAARMRHDLKNRIGGLKLYVTFLRRKLTEQPDLLEVVNKMSDSLDQMNLEANKIRF